MLKKTQKTTKDGSRPRKPSRQCSTNQQVSMKPFCVFDSSHIIYEEACGKSDISEERQDNGDFVFDKNSVKHTRKLKKSRSLIDSAQIKDLASGDHDKRNKTSVKRKTKSATKIKHKKNAQEGDKSPDDKVKLSQEIETVLEYKNANFDDNSSTFDSSSSNHEIDVLDVIEKRIYPRPVICPVQECSTMIALDSVMLHFFFDHSKVPRMTLNTTISRQISLTPSNLSTETQCFAVFFSHNKETLPSPTDAKILANSDNKCLMLMGARIQVQGPKTDGSKNKTKLRNPHTQTDLCNKKAIQMNNNIAKKSEAASEFDTNDMFNKDEVLLLWLCKLDKRSNNYSLSILSNNRKQGHNYIGEALHIRENQDVESVYQKSECLIIHGPAANKLLDEENKLSITISVLD